MTPFFPTRRSADLDSADDNHNVVIVAQQLEFEFLPAQLSLLYQYFMTGRRLHAPVQGGIKFFFLMDESATTPSKGIGWTYYQRKTDILSRFFPFQEGVGNL